MAAAMVMGSLAGCGQKAAPETTAAQTSEAKKEETAASEETKAEAESTGEQVELKVFGFKTGAEEGAIPELIEQFNKENPDIKVVYEGISNDEIAERLYISPHTVKNHIKSVYLKLGIHEKSEFIQYAHNNNLFND